MWESQFDELCGLRQIAVSWMVFQLHHAVLWQWCKMRNSRHWPLHLRKKAHYFRPGGEASPKVISFLGDSRSNVQRPPPTLNFFILLFWLQETQSFSSLLCLRHEKKSWIIGPLHGANLYTLKGYRSAPSKEAYKQFPHMYEKQNCFQIKVFL